MRTQADSVEAFALASDDAGIVFDPAEDKARQEFAAECDVNAILRRFGAGGFVPLPVVYGAQDLDLGLQEVFAAAEVATNAWAKLPERLRNRYPGWEELLAAIERGEAQLKEEVDVPRKEPAPPPGSVADPKVPVAP